MRANGVLGDEEVLRDLLGAVVLVAVLEGGYNLATLPRLVGAALEGFAANE